MRIIKAGIPEADASQLIRGVTLKSQAASLQIELLLVRCGEGSKEGCCTQSLRASGWRVSRGEAGPLFRMRRIGVRVFFLDTDRGKGSSRRLLRTAACRAAEAGRNSHSVRVAWFLLGAAVRPLRHDGTGPGCRNEAGQAEQQNTKNAEAAHGRSLR